MAFITILQESFAMSETDSRKQSDLFGLMLLLLGALVIFYLARPPVLMFLHYALGISRPQVDTGPPRPDLALITPPPAVPIKPPPIPASLSTPHTPTRWTDPIAGTLDMTALDTDIFTLTNQERTGRQLTALAEDPKLAKIAIRHSKDMVDRDYHAHVSPDGDGPAQRVAKLHRTLFGLTRENVALYSSTPIPVPELASRFNTQWMNSLGHRRNILAQENTHLGVGCWDAPDPHTQPNTIRKCTQLFSQSYAHAETPIPEEADAGTHIFLRLIVEPGQPLPTAIVQTDLRTDRAVPNAMPGKLTNQGRVAEGKLQLVGPPGLYGLSIQVPSDSAGIFSVIPGPYVRVR